MNRCAHSVAVIVIASILAAPTLACAPCPPLSGKPVVNADQSVIIIWDAATHTQHFIRRASFKSDADDFGFLVPTPAQPELSESGNAAFPFLQQLTEPEKRTVSRPSGVSCGCGGKSVTMKGSTQPAVRVLDEKVVAGFKAVVLESDSAKALVEWLKANGYAFSPQIEAWAKPYVESGWKITALKVAKSKDSTSEKTVTASALRMSFKTDRPLFPYREPEMESAAKAVGAKNRLLRIYFLAEARYQGGSSPEMHNWSGAVAWANRLNSTNRNQLLDLLGLPRNTGPADYWLTEFEDNWPYRAAPADVYFARSADQGTIARPPIIEYASSAWPGDIAVFAVAVITIMLVLARRIRRGNKRV